MTVCEDMFSRVQEMMPPSTEEAHDYFCRKLRCETDPFDVTNDRERGLDDFELIDVRSEQEPIPRDAELCSVGTAKILLELRDSAPRVLEPFLN